MKKFNIFLSTLAIAGSLTSCDLDSVSMTEQNDSNFPLDADDAASVLAAIYQNNNRINDFPQKTFLYLSMLASDDQFGGGGNNDYDMQAFDLIGNSGSDKTRDFYSARFQGISRANSFINMVDNLTMDEDAKKQAKGEALFLRAFYYYELASMYGKIPLVTNPPEYKIPETHAELWGQILLDLYTATQIMPDVRKTDGHVDKYCAEAMLGRAWLFYTGFFCNGETIADLTSTNYNPLTSVTLADGTTLKKEQVVAAIDDCVNNSGYALEDDFRELWAYTNKYTLPDIKEGNLGITADDKKNLVWAENDNNVGKESMFAIKFNKLASWNTIIGYGNGFALHFGVRDADNSNGTGFPFGQGWGAGPVATNLVEDWQKIEPKDKRFTYSVFPTAKFTKRSADFIQETDYFATKISSVIAKKEDGTYADQFEAVMYGTDGYINDNLMQTGAMHDLILIRFADVLLMQSELKEDASGINQIRKRAGLPEVAYSLEALQNERRWEFAFEGIRWNDIRRWHIAADALDKQQNVKIYVSQKERENSPQLGGYKARYNATAGFFKIPETEINLNNGALKQNEGWGSDAQYSAFN